VFGNWREEEEEEEEYKEDEEEDDEEGARRFLMCRVRWTVAFGVDMLVFSRVLAGTGVNLPIAGPAEVRRR